MRILAVSGSLRRESYNTQLLRAAEELAPAGVELELYEGLRHVPPYDADDDGDVVAAPVHDLRTRIAAADAVLFATPEFNSSIPGQLKNALDWASRPFKTNSLRNKPVAVVGATTGAYGAVWAQAEVRKVLGSIGARVVDVELPVAGAEEALGGNRLADAELQRRLARILAELVEAARDRHLIAA